ncbi:MULTISPECIES: GtrA family protein [unclassified Solwaraspora]|uniref:GtrA family protein n=1 Tax=unclassified Solwaraspora TaxID=2627926 RepID=UPI00259B8776|nr:GtrA family protein [Solwaraspora sp. WMMA2056]WJK40590.1 GtrA family protein [Solwaraspora sp. WMMA2056]
MRVLNLLPERWQKFVREVVKFGTVGGINTVINFAVFNALALTVLSDGQLKATVVAAIVATTSSYFMNRYWTYRDRPKSALQREYVLFFLFNITGLLIEVGILALAKYGFSIHGLLALNIIKIVGLVLGTIFRFWAYRTFVFRPAPRAAAGGPAPSDPAQPTGRVPQQLHRDPQLSTSVQVPDSPALLAEPGEARHPAEIATAASRPAPH